jgi:polysaccharide export outer membrane protein
LISYQDFNHSAVTMRRFLVSLVLLALAVSLAGCAANSYSANLASSPNTPYTLGSGDRVRVIVFGQDSLSNSYAVDGSGNIFMPLIGIVPAKGKTIEGLAHTIEVKLRNGYLRDPRVSVEVEAYRPFFILGEVSTPGQYPYINGMTAEKAVAIAGGFTPRGYKGSVDITRVVDGHPTTGQVPLTQLVRPGDTIVVHERYF